MQKYSLKGTSAAKNNSHFNWTSTAGVNEILNNELRKHLHTAPLGIFESDYYILNYPYSDYEPDDVFPPGFEKLTMIEQQRALLTLDRYYKDNGLYQQIWINATTTLAATYGPYVFSKLTGTVKGVYTKYINNTKGVNKTDFYVGEKSPTGYTTLKAADYEALNANIPKTRLDLHNDLINKGYTTNGPSNGGYLTYKNGDLKVNIRPNGEIISTRRVNVDPNNTSWNAEKYWQRTYYDGTPVPVGHNTYQYVESFNNASFIPQK